MSGPGPLATRTAKIANKALCPPTVLTNSPNKANAIKFLQTLFSSDSVAIQQSTGPEPIPPPVVSAPTTENFQWRCVCWFAPRRSLNRNAAAQISLLRRRSRWTH